MLTIEQTIVFDTLVRLVNSPNRNNPAHRWIITELERLLDRLFEDNP